LQSQASQQAVLYS